MKPRYFPQLLLGSLLVLGLGITWQGTSAQRDPSRFFPETGHTVAGEFLKFYDSVPNAELIFGYPFSRQFEDKRFGPPTQVQYFQRARFELKLNSAGEPVVELSPLGKRLYSGENGRFPPQSGGCKDLTNPETGHAHQVCFAFLAFYEDYGDAQIFGYPRSDFEQEDGFIVQYFDNAILAWHPEMPSGQKVQLVDIGSRYFYEVGESLELLNPDDRDDTIPLRSLLGLKVRAFTEKALVSEGDEQTLYVIVRDQKNEPVKGAQVKFILSLPNGETLANLMPSTDENGITRLSLNIHTEGEVGQATYEVITNILNLESQTRTSFRVWW